MIGRERETSEFKSLMLKKTASLVCVRGRRRIGKSTFIQFMGQKHFDYFYEFQCLAPREGQSNKKQLAHFSEQVRKQFKGPKVKLENWPEAFDYLAQNIPAHKKTLILLDEISWMGQFDYDFPAHLKIAWDTKFKNHKQLVLVLCGSVSSWIKKNILNNTGFVGRISLDLKIDELNLKNSLILGSLNRPQFSSHEQMRFLSFTGGVPKYLEELISLDGPEKNIERLCLKSSGILFSEFQNIFNDIFENKTLLYKKIILKLVDRKLSASEIAQQLKLPLNGDITENLDNLLESGFISKESSWSFDTLSLNKKPVYRISDNFLRFYLKYIDPMKLNDNQLSYSIQKIKNWESIIGLQFENLVLKNMNAVLKGLNLSPDEIVRFGPYRQIKNSKQQGCQFDLIIQTKYKVLYLCEIKSQRTLDKEIINEFESKIQKLKIKKHMSYRKVLIHIGEDNSFDFEENFFDYRISFEDLVENSN